MADWRSGGGAEKEVHVCCERGAEEVSLLEENEEAGGQLEGGDWRKGIGKSI